MPSLLFDMGFSLLILLGMSAYFRFPLTWRLVLLPAYLLLAAATGLGIGLWLATLAVRYRDVRNLAQYGLQIFKFLTPVVYSSSLILNHWQLLYRLNPMCWLVEGFRWMLLAVGGPASAMIAFPVVTVVLLFLGGAIVFRHTDRTIVDWL